MQGEYSLDSTKGKLPAQMPEAQMVLNGDEKFIEENTDRRLRMSQAKTHYHANKFPNTTIITKMAAGSHILLLNGQLPASRSRALGWVCSMYGIAQRWFFLQQPLSS